jgi:hypothetical protein
MVENGQVMHPRDVKRNERSGDWMGRLRNGQGPRDAASGASLGGISAVAQAHLLVLQLTEMPSPLPVSTVVR